MKKSNLNALIKAIHKLDDVYVKLEQIYDDEDDVFNSRSEKWQESDAGSELENDLSSLDDIKCAVESAKDDLENLLSSHDINPFD